jgi:RNA polymerase sigma factor (sigma-70 family)
VPVWFAEPNCCHISSGRAGSRTEQEEERPPPAHGLASRLIAGPTLRTQSDGRLVKLVREGYESAFEEIVRRYGRALGRYAAAIVGNRSEDVTQDAFSKALLALRRDEAEIELRPWLYRIVRNTALNDLRDRPVAAVELAETLAIGSNPAEAIEQREELTELMERLRALPDAQRAAIVMRELEGLSHDEIAAALGLSGGGARQAIYRARQALRDGAGMLVPLPLLKALLGPEGSAAAEAAGGAVGIAGAGFAVKATAATVLVAGTVGAGVALQEPKDANGRHGAARAAASRPSPDAASAPAAPLTTPFEGSSGPGPNSGAGREGDEGDEDRSGPGRSRDDRNDDDSSGRSGSDSERSGGDRSGSEQRNSSGSGHSASGDDGSGGHSGPGGGELNEPNSDDRSGSGDGSTSSGTSSGSGSGEDREPLESESSGSSSGSATSGAGESGSGSGSGSGDYPADLE